MANLETTRNRNGTNIKIRFKLDGKLRKLSLGTKYTLKQARIILSHVEEIADAKKTGSRISRSTAGFLADMTDDLRKRFTACGLIDRPALTTNLELWDLFIEETSHGKKESTMITYSTAKKRFFDFFKPKGLFRDLTKQDGENWKKYMSRSGLAEASIAGSIQRANALFNWAVEAGHLDRNPFKGIRRGSFVNRNRDFYIPMDWYYRLLDACPDQCWRTLISLCRIGGLRNPSETLSLTWADVNFINQSILVHSPKTEHHSGKESRLIPMFPELREELEASWDLAETGGSPYVIDRWRDTAANMRTQLRRIIFRAGLPEWERTFQNLRASRATDICNKYPAYVEKAWIGHSEKIAEAHYLQVTDDHFQKALARQPQARDADSTPSRLDDRLKAGIRNTKMPPN